MHVLFISACEKKAVRRTRAILDSYAIRAGERCWISAMTLEGLQSIRAALAQGATRQTAVACYQNDRSRRMKLLWIVGAHSRFGPEGHFSSGRRRANSPLAIPNWVRLSALVARLSGLQHDWGKLSLKFQNKLRGKASLQDAVRHEWISLKLAQAVRDGLSWLEAWQGIYPQRLKMRLGERILSDAAPYFPASALECTDALIATHHGLFEKPLSSPGSRLIKEDMACSGHSPLFTPWNSTTEPPFPELLNLVQNLQTRLRRLEKGLTGPEWTPLWRVVFLYARAALIFADHTVSAQKMPPCPDKAGEAFANTGRDTASPYLKQPLEEHLRRVAERAGETVWHMAALICRPEPALCGLEPCALTPVLRPAEEARFLWQNTAADALSVVREQHQDCGVLLFNSAGTGSGKTRMNVRAACLLSRSAAPRLSIALNLRSLTLQTGRAMQSQLGLDENDCATVIGDRVALRLFQSALGKEEDEAEILTTGGEWPLPAWLEAFLNKPRERRLMGAPLLVSTVDFLVAAGDPSTQGHGVKALVRLMSADLILDEVDAYEPEPLAAVLRLVQLSALFGRNVLCSSATLSKPVRLALEAAYASGASLARRLERSERAESPEKPLYLRAMIDNVLAPSVEAVPVQASPEAAEQAHATRIAEQIQASRTAPVCRLAELVRLDAESLSHWLEKIAQAVCRLHERHAFSDRRSGVKLSFGLVRVANIGTAVEVARYLAHALPNARVACYHAGDWRISRFYKEQRLDSLLSRAKGDAHILEDPEIRRILDQAKANQISDVPFVVVATPVEEVGRDHDFDWGVVDVSSAQSLVQVAGRINRHRERPVGDKPNIAVLQFNWRHCRNQDRGQKRSPAFCWPGYEGLGADLYSIHDLAQILPWDDRDQMVVTTAVRLDVDTSRRDTSRQNTSCRLAAREDKAIQKRLAPYFGPADGDFLVEPVPATLLFSQIYKKTALRPTTGKPELWRLGRDEEGKTCYERYEVDTHGAKVWVAQGSRAWSVSPAQPNAWLWLDAEAMRDLCRKTGVDEEDAMTVELLAYQEDGEWEYDQGFGIRRCPA